MMNFDKVHGHQKAKELMLRDWQKGNLAHAYLFHGQAELGKYTFARELAKNLICKQANCGVCSDCQQIDLGQHFDVLDYSDQGHSLKIAEIRALIEKINLTTQGAKKVIILQNIERMTVEAANCLLKSLEEPPARTVFLLTASTEQILETLVSRLRVVKFLPLQDAEMKDLLLMKFPQNDLELSQIRKVFFNRPGRMISFMKDADKMTIFKQINEHLKQLFDPRKKPMAKREILKLIQNEKEVTELFLELLSAALLEHAQLQSNEKKRLYYAALLDSVCRARDLINQNVNNRLLLENLLISI